jgi:hypothetical protein
VGSTVRSCAARYGEISSRNMKVLSIVPMGAKSNGQRVIAGISQNDLDANEIFRFIRIHFVW